VQDGAVGAGAERPHHLELADPKIAHEVAIRGGGAVYA
jgi:hypothetical protein